MTKKKPEVMYLSIVNLNGLVSKKPIRLKLNSSRYHPGQYWDSTGNFDLPEGRPRHGYKWFASPSRKEVLIWMKGVETVMKSLREWTK